MSKQRRVAGAGAQSRRRGYMTAGLSYTMTYSTETHTHTVHQWVPYTNCLSGEVVNKADNSQLFLA